MKYLDSIRRAGRGLKNAKVRTLLTSMAIGVGAFTITLALAAGAGARSFVDDLISSNVDPKSILIGVKRDDFGVEGGNQIHEYKDGDSAAKTVNDSDPSQYMFDQKLVDKIAALPEIKSVTPMYSVTSNYIQLEGSDKRYVANATTYDAGIALDVVNGSLPRIGDQLGDDDIVISENLAKIFVGDSGDTNGLVGKKLAINVPGSGTVEARDFVYTIVAVTKPAALSFMLGNDITLSAAGARETNEYTTQGTPLYQMYYGASAVAKDGVDPEVAKQAILATSDRLDAQSAKEVSSSVFQIVNIMQYGVMGFGAIALIAAVFGVINTQYISVLERTREIGLMKALGMRGRYVRRLFQLEAAWIGFLGGILGAVLAVILGLLVNPWLSKALSLPDGKHLLIFEPLSIALLVLALTLIAMLAGWYPSWKASRLDPVDALRSE